MKPEDLPVLFKASTNPSDWQRLAKQIAAEFITKQGADRHAFMGIIGAQMNANSWPAERRSYTFAAVDTDHIIDYLETKSFQIINWQTFFESKTAWGETEAMKKIYQAARENSVAINLNPVLTAATTRINALPGEVRIPDPKVIDVLLALGANPGSAIGPCLEEIRKGNMPIGRVFARYAEGVKHINFKGQAQAYREKGDFPMYKELYALYLEYGRYRRIDMETLEESKEDLKMRVVFNFASRRVLEIYEMVTPPVLRDFSFDEYEDNALQMAREKLIDIGGAPTDFGTLRRDKKTTPSPALSKERITGKFP